MRLTWNADDLALLEATDIFNAVLILKSRSHLMHCETFHWHNLLMTLLCLLKEFVEERGTILILRGVIRQVV